MQHHYRTFSNELKIGYVLLLSLSYLMNFIFNFVKEFNKVLPQIGRVLHKLLGNNYRLLYQERRYRNGENMRNLNRDFKFKLSFTKRIKTNIKERIRNI